MSVISVNEENFENEVIKSSKPVLIDFNADWCGPCRMLGPILDKISDENDSIKIVSINVDDNENIASEYSVSAIPCLVMIKDGKEEKRNVGLLSRSELDKFIGE